MEKNTFIQSFLIKWKRKKIKILKPLDNISSWFKNPVLSEKIQKGRSGSNLEILCIIWCNKYLFVLLCSMFLSIRCKFLTLLAEKQLRTLIFTFSFAVHFRQKSSFISFRCRYTQIRIAYCKRNELSSLKRTLVHSQWFNSRTSMLIKLSISFSSTLQNLSSMWIHICEDDFSTLFTYG